MRFVKKNGNIWPESEFIHTPEALKKLSDCNLTTQDLLVITEVYDCVKKQEHYLDHYDENSKEFNDEMRSFFRRMNNS